MRQILAASLACLTLGSASAQEMKFPSANSWMKPIRKSFLQTDPDYQGPEEFQQYDGDPLNRQDELRTHSPFFVSGSAIYGRVTGVPSILAYIDLNNRIQGLQQKPDAKWGFKAALGLSPNKTSKIIAQYTEMRSSSIQNFEYQVSLSVDAWPYGADVQEIDADPGLTIELGDKHAYQNVDLSVQTLSWMLGSYVRLHGVGGLRYLNYDNTATLNLSYEESADSGTIESQTDIKIKAPGAFIGTEIQYIVNRHFHFFSYLSGGVLAGYQKKVDSTVVEVLTPFSLAGLFGNLNLTNLNRNQEKRFEINFMPCMELRFGFSFDILLRKRLLVMASFAYELSSILHVATAPNTMATLLPSKTHFGSSQGTIVSTRGKYDAQSTIKTQGVVGTVTLSF